jgi:uncharacterized membrane protein YhfC
MDNKIYENAGSNALIMAIFSFFVPIIPIVYFIFLKKIDKTAVYLILIGAGTFVVFALSLEKIVHYFVFLIFPQLKKTIWPYFTYGGLMAALFEETGRLVIFFWIKNKQNVIENNLNSIFYGIGHGGIEVYMLVTLNNFVVCFYSKKAIENKLEPKLLEVLKNTFISLSKASSSDIFYVIYERIVAVNYHICASVIVWIGVMKNKIYLYFIALLLHFLTDFSIGISLEFKYYSKMRSLLYIVLSDMSILTLIIAMILWIKYIDNESKDISVNDSLPMVTDGNEI